MPDSLFVIFIARRINADASERLSRHQKTRCDGIKPSCGRCSKHQKPCHWPTGSAPGGFRAVSPEPRAVYENHRPVQIDNPDQRNLNFTTDDLPSHPIVSTLLNTFWTRHHPVELCGCIHREDFERTYSDDNNQFLLYSIIALSSLYAGPEDVDARFNDAKHFSDHYAAKARLASRMSSDEPAVVTIQANLCLGLRELLAMTDTKAWMYVGLATRMAQALRMRMEYNNRLHPLQREIRRRTFWACVMLDRLVAYCTFRTQTIDVDLVKIHLPSTRSAFAFGLDRRGTQFDAIGSTDDSSDLAEVLPYFIKTSVLWGNVAAFYVNRGRRWSLTAPHDPEGSCQMLNLRMMRWIEQLPDHLKWSEENLQAHNSLGSVEEYVNMHFLLKHSQMVIQQEYLPQTDEPDTVAGTVRTDSAGIPFISCDSNTLLTCLNTTRDIVGMIRTVNAVEVQSQHRPRLGVGIALTTAASVLLWAQYASHLTNHDDRVKIADDIACAKENFATLFETLKAWATCWDLAQAWCHSLMLLEELYKTFYKVDLAPMSVSEAIEEDDVHESESTPPSTRLREGDGLPEATKLPQGRYYKVRLVIGLAMEHPQMCRQILRLAEKSLRDTSWLSQIWNIPDSEILWNEEPPLTTEFNHWFSPVLTDDGPP